MNHVSYAHFARRSEALAALQECVEHFEAHPVEILVHRVDEPDSGLELAETHVRGGVLQGLAFGSIGGAVAALLAGWVGVRFFSLQPETIAFSIGAGLVIGALAGILSGAMNPHPLLERLRARAGGKGLLVSVKTEADATCSEAEAILRKHHGTVRSTAALATV